MEYFQFEGLPYLVCSSHTAYALSFKAFEIIGTHADGRPAFCSMSGDEQRTTRLSDAVVFFEGAITWQGVARVRWPIQDMGTLTFTGMDEARNPGRLFTQLFLYAAQVVTKADPNAFFGKKAVPTLKKRLGVKGYGSKKDPSSLVPSL